MLPSQLLLHLPAQQQGGRLQATLVLGLQPNHTKGLGREAPCSGTWQSGLGGGREEMAFYRTGGDGSGYLHSFFLIPVWLLLGWYIPAAQPGLPNLTSPALSKWVIIQHLLPTKGQRGVKDLGCDQRCPTWIISPSIQNQHLCPPHPLPFFFFLKLSDHLSTDHF